MSSPTVTSIFDPKLIEKQNKAFHRMSKKRQRIAIAKDVLAQIKAKKYVAKKGVYISSENLHLLCYVGKMDLQEALLTEAPDCNVCGLGAAFCSMARLGDEVRLGSNIHTKLAPIFGWRQVVLIESSFERSDYSNDGYKASDKELTACRRFFDRYPDSSRRLAAIFRNVIKNNGTFKP